MEWRENVGTPEGGELGKQIARLCDAEVAKNPEARERCATCAFRAGDHIANNSPETLMTALKAALEREPFWCHHVGPHGEQSLCAGWELMLAKQAVEVPWDYVEGTDSPAPPDGN
ncbi:hypothetical protein UFOVP1672_41 [uncultured Caudovirales phage]|uniref:Uncharacterized protein n=1 Tax=uncultured Caudovirales phage TaxID=2100421 RepID=A0A6J5T704_9CAUD|nr:hypothetical protein UFOVP988_63 [uncultured Caudovirales phage]CAB4211020.1 hypothetical protein UFOVP1425_63 [uncultured Caudovirales phage]CAB4223410.1 hypothetical protein UFOVP1672_41 [uncultured Caudovirales phage]